MKLTNDYKQGYTDAVNELRFNWINELDGVINEEQSIINEYYNGDIDDKQAEEKAYQIAEEFGGTDYPKKHQADCVHRDYFVQDAEEVSDE